MELAHGAQHALLGLRDHRHDVHARARADTLVQHGRRLQEVAAPSPLAATAAPLTHRETRVAYVGVGCVVRSEWRRGCGENGAERAVSLALPTAPDPSPLGFRGDCLERIAVHQRRLEPRCLGALVLAVAVFLERFRAQPHRHVTLRQVAHLRPRAQVARFRWWLTPTSSRQAGWKQAACAALLARARVYHAAAHAEGLEEQRHVACSIQGGARHLRRGAVRKPPPKLELVHHHGSPWPPRKAQSVSTGFPERAAIESRMASVA